MRPVQRGASPQAQDFDPYEAAKVFLVSRLGSYCSFCERYIPTNLAVEHIQPKKGAYAHPHLIGCWENFLLACVNCNSTKKDKRVELDQVLLPDRDNTAAAYTYTAAGGVEAAAGLSVAQRTLAENTLRLVGLDKHSAPTRDENDHAVALERRSQRYEAWLEAEDAREDLQRHRSPVLLRRIVEEAANKGFFSVWMTVFHEDPEMRLALIQRFEGTAASGCFGLYTAAHVCPAPNPDGLPHGGKV